MNRKKYLTRGEKYIDYAIGAVGFLIVNAVIYILINLLVSPLLPLDHEAGWARETASQVVEYAVMILPWAINIALLAFFAWWRPWIAIGAISFWTLLIVVSVLVGLCLGACLFAGCLLLAGISSLH
jgi:hypothetical protein